MSSKMLSARRPPCAALLLCVLLATRSAAEAQECDVDDPSTTATAAAAAAAAVAEAPSPPATYLSRLLSLWQSPPKQSDASASAASGEDAEDIVWSPVPRGAAPEALPSVYSFSNASSPFPPRRQQPIAVGVAAPARELRVKNAMLHAWAGYKRHAWGQDELEPSRSWASPRSAWVSRSSTPSTR